MFTNLRAFLQQPFPDVQGLVFSFRSSLVVGLFIFLFLYSFQPFGLSTVSQPLLITATFGLITFLVSMLYEIFVFYTLEIERDKPVWTYGKWLIFTLVLVGLIAIANFLYITYLGFVEFSFSALLLMLRQTYIIGIFPIVFSGMIRVISAQRKNSQTAEQVVLPIQKKLHRPVQITNYNASETHELDEDAICYVEALQNYVSIYHIEDGTVKKTTLRNTLSATEKQLAETSTIRCHRSFLVNRERITKVDGNAQGLKLTLEGLEGQVPVSRKYISVFR